MDITEAFRDGHFAPGSPTHGEFNCPNCGAAISSEKCPYCGTVFYDFSCVDFNKPTYLKIRKDNRVLICRVLLQDCTMRQTSDPSALFCNNKPYIVTPRNPEMTITLEFNVISNNKDCLYVELDEERFGK